LERSPKFVFQHRFFLRWCKLYRNANSPGLRFQASGYIYPFTKDLASVLDYVSHVKADPELHLAMIGLVDVPGLHFVLERRRARDSIKDAPEFDEKAVSRGVHNPAPMQLHELVQQFPVVGQRANCTHLVLAHEAAVPGYVGVQHSYQLSAKPISRHGIHLPMKGPRHVRSLLTA
jgi:hypothetical protein